MAMELGNHQDPFVVAMVKPVVKIGHILKMGLSVHSMSLTGLLGCMVCSQLSSS